MGWTSELNTVKAHCTEKDDEIAFLKETHASLEGDLTSELTTLKAQSTEKRDEIECMVDSNSALQQQVLTLETNLEESRGRLHRLQQEQVSAAGKQEALESSESRDLPSVRVWIALRELPLSVGKVVAERFLLKMVAPPPPSDLLPLQPQS